MAASCSAIFSYSSSFSLSVRSWKGFCDDCSRVFLSCGRPSRKETEERIFNFIWKNTNQAFYGGGQHCFKNSTAFSPDSFSNKPHHNKFVPLAVTWLAGEGQISFCIMILHGVKTLFIYKTDFGWWVCWSFCFIFTPSGSQLVSMQIDRYL